jgi:hypothetical protein
MEISKRLGSNSEYRTLTGSFLEFSHLFTIEFLHVENTIPLGEVETRIYPLFLQGQRRELS